MSLLPLAGCLASLHFRCLLMLCYHRNPVTPLE
uniref:Uncharacterized protein n=1 Tax=Anguilla anguilla TaxID=7936 RepID=A0A0E9STP8_ANGAN